MINNDEYHDAMDGPMESLGVEIWGIKGEGGENLKDFEIVNAATKRIKVLKEMLLTTGFNRDLLNLMMREL